MDAEKHCVGIEVKLDVHATAHNDVNLYRLVLMMGTARMFGPPAFLENRHDLRQTDLPYGQQILLIDIVP
jgi:hypothetical protein